ncbi:hypothetical protein DYI42_16655 [Vannielia litorea]|nr:hypothetical protein [Vannielia litorea]
MVAGFRYPLRMALARLANGGLWAWSPVALDDDLRGEIGALGEVEAIVAPNGLHDLYLRDWAKAWPAAQLYGPDAEALPGLQRWPETGWPGQIDLAVLRNRITEEAVFFHRPSRTALFCDVIQNFPPGYQAGWRGLVARLDLMESGAPAVPRKFRLGFAGRRAEARVAMRQILGWQPERLVMAHGTVLETGAAPALARAFGWLGDG